MSDYLEDHVRHLVSDRIADIEPASANPIIIKLGAQYSIRERSGGRVNRNFYSPEWAAHKLGIPYGQLECIMMLRPLRPSFVRINAPYLSDGDITELACLIKRPSIFSVLRRGK